MEDAFDKERYDALLFNRLVPICSKQFLRKRLKFSGLFKDIDRTCSEFLPSFSNHGFCTTRNGYALSNLFRRNHHLETFNKTFYPKNIQQIVENIEEDRSLHHFTFVMDRSVYKDMKRGVKWNQTTTGEFKLSIHSPKDVADIRGWMNEIVTAPTGFITTIKVRPSTIVSEPYVRYIGVEKRKCRFSDENEELTSFKFYSRINCLLDCNSDYAEKTCGCRPWDYPQATKHNDTAEEKKRICDFFGNTCFNMILENKKADFCAKKCVPDCDEVSYAITINVYPMNDAVICDANSDPTTLLEYQIKRHIMSLFSRDPEWTKNNYISNYSPEQRLINLVQDVLTNSSETERFKNDCKAKLDSDIAAVDVNIVSPKYSRINKIVKATWFDKLAVFGKNSNFYFISSLKLKNNERLYNSKTKLYSIIIITGGNVGLFTGMSILSICEIVFWLARFVSGIAGRSITRIK